MIDDIENQITARLAPHAETVRKVAWALVVINLVVGVVALAGFNIIGMALGAANAIAGFWLLLQSRKVTSPTP